MAIRYKTSVLVVAEEEREASCQQVNGAKLLKMCKDAARRSECLRCLRERIARRIRHHD